MQNVHCCKTKTLLLRKKQNLQKDNSRPCNLLSVKETEKKLIINFILIFCQLDSQWKVNVHMTLWYISLNLNKYISSFMALTIYFTRVCQIQSHQHIVTQCYSNHIVTHNNINDIAWWSGNNTYKIYNSVMLKLLSGKAMFELLQ